MQLAPIPVGKCVCMYGELCVTGRFWKAGEGKRGDRQRRRRKWGQKGDQKEESLRRGEQCRAKGERRRGTERERGEERSLVLLFLVTPKEREWGFRNSVHLS